MKRKYGKVIVYKKDGSTEMYNKVWRVGEILNNDIPAKRLCFFNNSEVIIKDEDIEKMVFE